jgi:MoaA/NifB/PqqE/SkfB family radical SAM enzyme
MQEAVFEYLQDPFLARLATEMQQAGRIKAALVDITHRCNLRCSGCYFYSDQIDRHEEVADENVFDAFVESEKNRGTNFMTVLGGEPTLRLDRLKKIYDNFWMMVVTNGLKKIPYEGFETMPIAISVWGNHKTDMALRGNGKIDVFQRALDNYRDDKRVVWYYTNMAGNADDIESVTEQCIANGNYMGYNFYGDISHLGGKCDHTNGFDDVRSMIDAMILKYPDKIYNLSYVNKIIGTGELYDETWGYDVCCSITYDHEENRERIKNGHYYNKHFRAYNPDLITTRKCCVGEKRNCTNCYDLWAHMSWIMMNAKKHLASIQEFTHWLCTCYLFYLTNRIVNFDEGIKLLPEIHERSCKAVIDEFLLAKSV